MKQQINLHNRVVEYSVLRSDRAKRMRLAVYCDGNFVVTVPKVLPADSIDRYLIEKSKWVVSKLDFFEQLNKRQKLSLGVDGFEVYRDKALKMVTHRIEELNNELYKFKFNQITVKNQKTRWGSCSKKRNLNFNYKILFLSPRMRDYIIIHELCHLREFNHSNKFWRLVAKAIPNYVDIVEELKIKGLMIG
ncbi:MAG: metal-dependent hydrolase [Candidatus Portnoybacteria bacterium CG10_big_fil_rev_8_21_14_0_10_36_7]|uniref:Metal-dependent hydrolase n=1 Tax=Candidatus Portnoybacteria bacterium CG10_big_fil_rev_8_21_14_0_10_36_7 TaxID=1974812 RepID=A0A2M8KEH7_9BACT|nr:MAG: metal-dependent hydrolase [Candidatus Portnoybacteria bacterium CG10_big_fil_rev_8_21_14_0_10_36_7]